MKISVSVVVIGDELLIGQVTDTNSGEIARRIAPLGWEIAGVEVVHDDAAAITEGIERAMRRSPIVLTTGGLGPTKDDITKATLCNIFGGTLRRDADVTENINRIFAQRGLAMNALTADQALVPTTCQVVPNTRGTAPIMWFERDGRVLVAMPGVPFETVGALDDEVIPRLARHFAGREPMGRRTMMVCGVSESALAQRLDDYERQLPPQLHLAYLPDAGLIRLRLDAHGLPGQQQADIDAMLDDYAARLRALLADNLIYDGDATAAQIALHYLRQNHYAVGSAESCTGGNIAHAFTSIAGASDTYYGSVVSYDNSVKINVLGVSAATLAAHGAVSEEVVRQMAEGARRVLGVDCAVATSGIAGPGGGTPDKPVGTVWMAVATPDGTTTQLGHFGRTGRLSVINRATTAALLMLAKTLR